MHLAQLFPQHWPIKLGGTVYSVPPLRLRDVAKFQAWLAVFKPCPLEVVQPELEQLADGDRRERLAQIYLDCEQWPIRYGTPEAARAFSTRIGCEYWLTIVFERAIPRPMPATIADLVTELSAEDWTKLTRLVYELDPLDAIVGMFEPQAAVEESINWAEAIADVVEATGWTIEQIGDLTLSQWHTIRTGGKAERGQLEALPGETWQETSERRRRLFYGDDWDKPTAEEDKLFADAEALFAKFGPKPETE